MLRNSTPDNRCQRTPTSQRTRGMVTLARFMPVPPLRKTGLLTALLVLCFILNAGESLAQTSDDHGNTTGTATALTLGTAVDGVIDPADDFDVFSFEVPDTVEIIDVWVYTEGSIEDTVGAIFDGTGTIIASQRRQCPLWKTSPTSILERASFRVPTLWP